MDYAAISKKTFLHIYSAYLSLNDSPLDKAIKTLVELRVSQINGCACCCLLHIEEARKCGVSQEKLDILPIWASSKNIYNNKEALALHWCEAVTGISPDSKKIRNMLKNYFTEREIVDLTACISLMNALNRMAISLKQ